MIIHKLRSRFSEAYRIEHGWGLSPVRNKREMRALIKFCKDQIHERKEYDIPVQKYHWVYLVTIRMYERREVSPLLFNKRFNPEQLDYFSIRDFINEHAGYYWS